jgi:hypothetical protein
MAPVTLRAVGRIPTRREKLAAERKALKAPPQPELVGEFLAALRGLW